MIKKQEADNRHVINYQQKSVQCVVMKWKERSQYFRGRVSALMSTLAHAAAVKQQKWKNNLGSFASIVEC